jgi:HlyD family secretion protein
LRAPFTGTVTALNISLGELAATAAPVVTLADLERLQAETTDLSERDVARVRVGQSATVLIEPLDVTVPGTVARISPQANIIGGDVVYTVLIDLDEQPAEVRWGMSVEVDIATDQ